MALASALPPPIERLCDCSRKHNTLLYIHYHQFLGFDDYEQSAAQTCGKYAYLLTTIIVDVLDGVTRTLRAETLLMVSNRLCSIVDIIII